MLEEPVTVVVRRVKPGSRGGLRERDAGVHPVRARLPGNRGINVLRPPPVFSWLLPSWHPQLANVLMSVLVVTLLTWPVMPLLTRLFAPWLYGRSP